MGIYYMTMENFEDLNFCIDIFSQSLGARRSGVEILIEWKASDLDMFVWLCTGYLAFLNPNSNDEITRNQKYMIAKSQIYSGSQTTIATSTCYHIFLLWRKRVTMTIQPICQSRQFTYCLFWEDICPFTPHGFLFHFSGFEPKTFALWET